MSGKSWGVAIVGLGHWYSAYGLARALPEYGKAHLVGVAADDERRLTEFAGTFGVDGTRDVEALLARPDVDIVHIATPVAQSAAATVAAARAGKHLIVGKPMAMTLDEADAMVDAVEKSGVVCVPFSGIMRLRGAALQARLARGEIGELAVVHQTSRWSIAEDWLRSGSPGWFVDPAQVPGGAFIDEGIYWIDMLRFLTGSDVVEVEARMRNLVHRELAVEDWGLATFTFANGVIATLEASWTINSPRATAPSPKHNSVVRLELVGTRGEIAEQWFRDPGRAVLAAGAEQWIFERQAESAFGPATPFPLDYLIGCLERGEPSAATIHDARAALAVALAAYESHRRGAPVRL